MPRTYTTRDGDMLDLICYRAYGGRQAGAVEAVLEANQPINLSDQPPVLARGITLVLPDLPSSVAEVRLVKLWD